MFFAEVILLRRLGERLRSAQLAPPMRGLVRITEMDRDTTNFKRNIVVVDLWERYGTTSRRALANMAEPVLLPIDDRTRERLPGGGEGLLIAGTELEVTDGGRTIKEHRQVWLCRPIVSPD